MTSHSPGRLNRRLMPWIARITSRARLISRRTAVLLTRLSFHPRRQHLVGRSQIQHLKKNPASHRPSLTKPWEWAATAGILSAVLVLILLLSLDSSQQSGVNQQVTKTIQPRFETDSTQFVEQDHAMAALRERPEPVRPDHKPPTQHPAPVHSAVTTAPGNQADAIDRPPVPRPVPEWEPTLSAVTREPEPDVQDDDPAPINSSPPNLEMTISSRLDGPESAFSVLSQPIQPQPLIDIFSSRGWQLADRNKATLISPFVGRPFDPGRLTEDRIIDLDAQSRLMSDIEVRKSFPRSAAPGVTVQYQIDVTNHGKSVVHGFRLIERTPPDMTVTNSIPAGRFEQGILVWSIAELSPGTTQTFRYELVPIRAALASSVTRMEQQSSVQSISVVETERIDLNVSAPAQVRNQEWFAIRMTITNSGTATLNLARLQLRLPDAVQHPFGQNLEHDVPELAPGVSHQVQLHVRATSGSSAANIEATVQRAGRTIAAGDTEVTVERHPPRPPFRVGKIPVGPSRRCRP